MKEWLNTSVTLTHYGSRSKENKQCIWRDVKNRALQCKRLESLSNYLLMAKFKIYKLHFSSPLHISGSRDDSGLSLRTIQSDSLYAAIMATLAKVGTEIPSDGDLGFSLSSTFPISKKHVRKRQLTSCLCLCEQNYHN